MHNRTAIIETYDDQALGGFPWKTKNSYYHEHLHRLVSFLVPRGQTVLELGCGNGDLLAKLDPSRGVGIDFSARSVEAARVRHPHLEFQVMDATALELDEPFDYILLSDLVGELEDVWQVFQQLHRVTGPRSRIIITYFNYLWAPALRLAEKLGLKMPQSHQNWLSQRDIVNFLQLTEFEIVRTGWHTLLPVDVPILSTLLNRYCAFLPILRRLCLTHYIVARPSPSTVRVDESKISCTVLIPTRNEKGNVQTAIDRLPAMGSHTEIMFVDGCSTDGTVEEIERLIETHRDSLDIKLVHQVPRETADKQDMNSGKMLKLGKGDAVRKGFDRASGDILMILDADLTVPPEELPKFFTLTARRAGELTMGTRLVYPMEKQAMRFLNILGNKFFSFLFSWLLDQSVKDTLCGTKVLWRDDYQLIKDNRDFFGDFDPFGDFDLIFGAAKLNLRIAELPIRYRQRVYGDIKIERFKHGLILLRMCLLALKRFKLMHGVETQRKTL